nr:hypothetical protein [Streptomyces sp. A3M-1-3]
MSSGAEGELPGSPVGSITPHGERGGRTEARTDAVAAVSAPARWY